tara:strand:- start:511 stop:702 length:192 start_codon:yes stop_codon:yes gene_type:complete
MLGAVCITIGVTLIDVMVYARQSGPLRVSNPQVTMGTVELGSDYTIYLLDCLSQRGEAWASPV